jgi:LysM repeat protein
MSGARQLLAGVLGGAILIGLLAGGLLLSAGDARIAFQPSPTAPPATPSAPTPPFDTPVVAATPTDSLAATSTPTLAPAGACPRPAGWLDYVVGPADNLAGIAAQLGVDPILLQVYNCLIDPIVAPGQIIFVPAPATATATLPGVTPIPTVCGPPLGWRIYIVQRGDTLSSIARATGTTPEQLMLANCLDTSRIYPGQRLFVPRLPFATPTRFAPPTWTSTPTPSPTPIDTFTPSPTATFGFPTDTPTWTPTPFPPTDTPTPSESPTPIASPTFTPTVDVPPPTSTPMPTDTPSATP